MGTSNSSGFRAKVEKQIKDNPVLMYSTGFCVYCVKAKSLFETMRINPYIVYLDKDPDGDEISMALYEITGQDTVPNIFIGGKHVGGYSQLLNGVKIGSVQSALRKIGVVFEDFGS